MNKDTTLYAQQRTVAELEALIDQANRVRMVQFDAPTDAQQRAARSLVERLIDKMLGRDGG